MSPDTLATIAAFLLAAACVLALRMVRPLDSPQPRHGAAWLDAHHVPFEARYGPYDDGPIPDALNIARTA